MSSLLDRLGVEIPLIQAPMAGTSTPTMAASVTNAGGLGSIAVGAVDAAAAAMMLDDLKRLTDGPFNVNVFCHGPSAHDADRERTWLKALNPVFERYGAAPPAAIHEIYRSFREDDAMLQLLVEAKPAVVSFHFGLPSADAITRLKAEGILLFSSATSLDEAQAAAKAGVDAIVAQGFEAGGHRGLFDPAAPDAELGVLALARLLVQEIDLPVIAAGGIMDGAGIAAVLALGATGAQLGTAFIGCPESSADQYHRAALFGPAAAMTTMTSVISGRPARCLANNFTELSKTVLAGLDIPDYPIAYDAGKAVATAAKAMGDGGFGAQWAGQGAPLARSMPAADLVRTLKAELEMARNT